MRSRRGRNEGSIYKRADGVWCSNINLGYDGAGKRKRRVVYGTSKREVNEKLMELQQSSAAGLLTDPTNLTVAQYSELWLRDNARQRLRPGTVALYERLVKNHIKPHLGAVNLGKLNTSQVKHLFTHLSETGVGNRTRELTFIVLNCVLTAALGEGIISKNPCVPVTKPVAVKKEMKYFTPEQTVQFIQAACGHRLEALFILAVTLGIRQGELLGLQWQDIDFQSARVFIRRNLSEQKGRLVVGEPKTKSSRRAIPLTTRAMQALQAHRERMLGEGHTGQYVFVDRVGGPIRKSNLVHRDFPRLIQAAGVIKIRFHDLRHTAATLMLISAVHPKVVSEILGHASVAFTLTVYAHVLPSLQPQAVYDVEAMLDKRAEQIEQRALALAAMQLNSEAVN